MEINKVLITGITGQIGIYLSAYLLSLGYKVYGLVRDSTHKTENIDGRVILLDGDITDSVSVEAIIRKHQFDAVYNLAAISHIGKSFSQPELTMNVNASGVLRLLEAIRQHSPQTRFFQSSTIEMFAGSGLATVDESTPISPVSPYSIAKAAAHQYVKLYREAYGLKAYTGIFSNCESPYRGHQFVTRKIIDWLARYSKDANISPLQLGFLDSYRDFGHAKDYVRAVETIVASDTPSDYMICTGRANSVRKFIEAALMHSGFTINWDGSGLKETGRINGKVAITISPEFYRPTNVPILYGNPARINSVLNWKSSVSFTELVKEMVDFHVYSRTISIL